MKITEANIKKRDSEFEHGPFSKVKFEENEIHLKIPDSTIYGWKIRQLNQLLVHTYLQTGQTIYIYYDVFDRCPKKMLTSTQVLTS